MKNIKKMLCLAIVATLLLGVMSGCGGKKADDETIVIGAVAPLTGESALWGDVLVDTLKMLVAQTNEAGGLLGRQVELKTYDNRNDAVETTNAARKAIETDNVVAFIGTDSSSTTIPLAEVCTEYNIPLITHIATNSKVTMTDSGEVRKNVFRSCLNDPQVGGIFGAYVAEEMGVKRVAAIYNIGSDYSLGVKNEFVKAFTEAGGTVTAELAYNTGDVDFRAQLSNLKDAEDFDAIYLASSTYKEIGLIANQARALDLHQQLLCLNAMLAEDIFNIAGENIEGSTFISLSNIDAGMVEQFKADFLEFNGYDCAENIAGDAYLAYDAYKMLTTAIENAGSVDSDAICKAISEIKDLQGLTCKISVNAENHNTIRETPIYRIENQEFVIVDMYTAKN